MTYFQHYFYNKFNIALHSAEVWYCIDDETNVFLIHTRDWLAEMLDVARQTVCYSKAQSIVFYTPERYMKQEEIVI